MAYRDYPSRVPVDPLEKEKFMRRVGLEHLLRVWQWFEVYHLNPYRMPYFAMKKEEYADEEGESGDGGGFKIIDVEKGFKIYDFGDYLVTSAGEDYGPLATGAALRTVDRMMEKLKERHVQEIAFGKTCFEPAKLYAWKKAVQAGIKVYDYQPTEEDILRLTHTYGELGHLLEEVMRPE